MADHEIIVSGKGVLAPQTLSIPHGDTVTWRWGDGNYHRIMAQDGSYDSGAQRNPPGGAVITYRQAFAVPGTFQYSDVAARKPIIGTITVT